MTEITGLEYLKKNEIKNKACVFERPYVFISYSHDKHDAQIVMNIFKKLYDKGYNLWIDTANIPHDENSWKDAAYRALMNPNCKLAFYFRSESSMVKETIATEITTIDKIQSIKRIVCIDIWEDSTINAEEFQTRMLNTGNFGVKEKSCMDICHIVKPTNSAIRLASDVDNDIDRLIEAIKEEMISESDFHFKRNLSESDQTPPDKTFPEQSQYVASSPAYKAADATKTPSQSTGTASAKDGSVGNQRISILDFVKKYKNKTFNRKAFENVRLVGIDGYEAYSTGFYDSTATLVWDFIMARLEEKQEYIQIINSKNPKAKNPPFITTQEYEEGKSVSYKEVTIPGLGNWYMCTNFSQYDWLASILKGRISDIGLPVDKFYLEFTDSAEGASDAAYTNTAAEPAVESVSAVNEVAVTEVADTTEETETTDYSIGNQEISLLQFAKKYCNPSNKNVPANKIPFSKNTFQQIKLVGKGEYAGYSTNFYNTTADLTWEFVMARLNEEKEAYIERCNRLNAGSKNPPFISAEEYNRRKQKEIETGKKMLSYKAVTAEGLENYYMCTNFSQYDWIGKILINRMKEQGLPIEQFALEYVAG